MHVGGAGRGALGAAVVAVALLPKLRHVIAVLWGPTPTHLPTWPLPVGVHATVLPHCHAVGWMVECARVRASHFADPFYVIFKVPIAL